MTLEAALACLDEHGFCVIQQLIGPDMVTALRDSIDRHLDPEGDLAPASNRYHMAFAEDSEPVWDLVDHPDYMQFIRTVHGTDDLCLHRSAAILRTPGEGMGRWHQDHRGHIEQPQRANDVLNRFPIPSGAWFYLNGSHPDRSGIAVIEKSHHLEWDGPDGFVMGPDRAGLFPKGGTPDTPYDPMAVPGCVPVIADPGDLICFAALTWHANMATRERRYSCGIGFRPKSWPQRRAVAPARFGRRPRRTPARPSEALHRGLYGFRRGMEGGVAGAIGVYVLWWSSGCSTQFGTRVSYRTSNRPGKAETSSMHRGVGEFIEFAFTRSTCQHGDKGYSSPFGR